MLLLILMMLHLLVKNYLNLILIAKKADPQIADKIIKQKKLFGLYILFKNYILFFGCGI